MRLPSQPTLRASAIAVTALALAAGVVIGRDDQPSAPQPLTSAPAIAPPATPGAARSASDLPEGDLPIERLQRRHREGVAGDLFLPRESATALASVRAQAPGSAKPGPDAAVAVAPAPPPRPTAPALPFRYAGRLEEGGRTLAFLMRGDAPVSVEAGDEIDGLYRVDAITAAAVEFTYLPLGERQTLGFPGPNP